MNEQNRIRYMRYCIDLLEKNLSEGQYPIAAAVVSETGQIISSSCSSLRNGNDPTNHPEMEAIRTACEKRKSRTLSDCYLFTTLEPCPMCASAAIWAKMKGIVFGALQEDAIAFIRENPDRQFSWRQIEVKARDVISHGEPKLDLYEGVLREECRNLFV